MILIALLLGCFLSTWEISNALESSLKALQHILGPKEMKLQSLLENSCDSSIMGITICNADDKAVYLTMVVDVAT